MNRQRPEPEAVAQQHFQIGQVVARVEHEPRVLRRKHQLELCNIDQRVAHVVVEQPTSFEKRSAGGDEQQHERKSGGPHGMRKAVVITAQASQVQPIRQPDGRVDQKQEKEFPVADADTRVQPRAVVVHAQHATIATAAVVSARWFKGSARLTKMDERTVGVTTTSLNNRQRLGLCAGLLTRAAFAVLAPPVN